ncbi:MAG: hypothetical protein BA862_07455 [Desulfobulbaceae bacterium S3730MH12]|nr:MAG: hypothetical protein BA866_08955 [Desulfobulbaceae bacterium S5133MH15]OEU58443.1 MAG: hypothetical protein BA862_07455 [Desulfobulbaceae bacterium S3730MH12]OEU81408.1 MAG: hypothetical protein BA873_13620 [Desulfobulbaceae bacterium C00003063]
MKLHIFCLSTVMILLTSCAVEKQRHLPNLSPAPALEETSCSAAVFPQGKWQFIHAIDFSMKNGAGTAVIGVTSLSRNRIDCALITIEGLTLFEAAYEEEKGLEIRRAVPPFDKPLFAEGLIRDLRTIFQPPTGGMQTGQIPGAITVCRYADNMGRVIDVLPEADDCWQINIYNSEMTLDRSITGRSCRNNGSAQVPEYLELNSYGQTGYTLKMTLIRADKL